MSAGSLLAAPDQDPGSSFRTFPSAIQLTPELLDAPVAAPVIAGDHVVVALKSGVVIAKRLDDGREAWVEQLSATGQLAASNDVVLVPAHGAAHALRADTGQKMWTREIASLTAPPLVREGWIVLVSGEELTALRSADGAVVWTKTIAPMMQRPTIDGDVLYVALVDGRLLALELTSGNVIWERRVGTNLTEPLVFGDRVYVGASGKTFACVKTADGEVDWEYPIGASTVGTAAVDQTRVYVASMDNLLRAFRRSNGAREWQQDVGYRPIGGPVITGSTVSVPGHTAKLRGFDRTTHKPIAELTLPTPARTAPAFSPPRKGMPGKLAVITNDYGKPWLLVVAAEAPPEPPTLSVSPLTALPGTVLPIPKLPI